MMKPQNRLRVLLLVLIGAAFTASQSRPLMRRLLPDRSGASPIRWQTSLDAAKVIAAREKKPIFVDFYAIWCGPCQDMLQTTYRDPDVERRLNHDFVPVLIDIDKQPALAARFNVNAIPDGAFLASDGQRELVRSVGYESADTYLDLADQALKAAAKLPPLPAGSTSHLSSSSPLSSPFPTLPLSVGFP